MFHYAYFICDCLFLEIIFNYNEIIREKNKKKLIFIYIIFTIHPKYYLKEN